MRNAAARVGIPVAMRDDVSMTLRERAGVGALIAAGIVLRVLCFLHYRFDSDEPQHLHVAWGWTRGLVQYRDLFDVGE